MKKTTAQSVCKNNWLFVCLYISLRSTCFVLLSCKPNICVSWSTSGLRVRLAPLNRFGPSSKIFCWPFWGGASFVDLLCFCSVLCLLCFVRVCLCVLCGRLLGGGLTSWLSFVVSSVGLSLSHWCPGSGVVLGCVDSWSLQPYLLYINSYLCVMHLFLSEEARYLKKTVLILMLYHLFILMFIYI